MLDGMTNIKASEVLKEIKYYTEDLPPYSPDEVAEALEMAIEALDQRWIPVSERLPEEIRTKGYGLCNVIVTHKCAGITRTSLAVFDKGKFYTNNNFKRNDTSVIAWMPLPEPYKTESEDE